MQREESFEAAFQFLGDDDLALLAALALADQQRRLAVSQEAVPDSEGGNLGGAETGGEERGCRGGPRSGRPSRRRSPCARKPESSRPFSPVD